MTISPPTAVARRTSIGVNGIRMRNTRVVLLLIGVTNLAVALVSAFFDRLWMLSGVVVLPLALLAIWRKNTLFCLLLASGILIDIVVQVIFAMRNDGRVLVFTVDALLALLKLLSLYYTYRFWKVVQVRNKYKKRENSLREMDDDMYL
mmetsp:Transcript_21137/g.23598  ORF Transcript_21137/g.23598 Transcript_21137/m.23598 type:complete len:148 (+) Transcript_21137:345-788(+)